MNRIQRSSINSLANVSGYVVPLAVSIVATPILLHNLGAEAFGIQNLVNAIMGYFFVLEAGLDLAVIRYLSEDRANGDRRSSHAMVSTSLSWYLVVGCIGMVAIMLSANFFAQTVFAIPERNLQQAIISFRLAGIGFLASMVAFWARAVSAGYQRYEVYNGISIFTTTIGTGLGIILVLLGFDLVAYVGARIGISFLFSFVYFFAVRKLVGRELSHLRWERGSLRRIRSYLPLGFIGRVTGVIMMWLDNTLIALWLGAAALAAYVPPFSIVNIAVYFTASTLSFVFPMASELFHSNRRAEFRNLLVTGLRFVTGVSTIIFVQLAVFGDLFLTLWLGPALAQESALVFRLLAAAGFLAVIAGTVPNNVMPATGHMQVYSTFSVLRTGVFALTCMLLIRSIGIAGAGIGLLMAALLDVVYAWVAYRRYLNIPPGDLLKFSLARPLLLGIPLLVVAILMRPLAASWIGLIASVAVLSAAYVMIGFYVGVFGALEKQALLGLMQVVASQFRRSRQHN